MATGINPGKAIVTLIVRREMLWPVHIAAMTHSSLSFDNFSPGPTSKAAPTLSLPQAGPWSRTGQGPALAVVPHWLWSRTGYGPGNGPVPGHGHGSGRPAAAAAAGPGGWAGGCYGGGASQAAQFVKLWTATAQLVLS